MKFSTRICCYCFTGHHCWHQQPGKDKEAAIKGTNHKRKRNLQAGTYTEIFKPLS